MTQQEFEQIVRRTVTSDFYEYIVECMYYAYKGEKDDFCKEFTECFGKQFSEEKVSRINHFLTDELVRHIERKTKEIEELRATIDEMAKFIAKPAFEGIEGARRAFVYAKGWETYLNLKIKNDFTLDDIEKKHLEELLTKK